MASLPPDEATALRRAKLLVGLFANCRPDNPDTFMFGLGKVFEAFPLLVVDACCDPLAGLPRARFTIDSPKPVADWCEDRVELNKKLIAVAAARAAK